MLETTPSPGTVFVSHAHADNALCDIYVGALRKRGLDVWYDRTNLQVGRSLSSDIEAELKRRTAFVVIATPASLASQWVRSEIAAFRSLAAHDPTRLFLPVRAAECEMPLLWADILWIDAVSLGFEAAVDAMAVALGTPTVPAPTPKPATTPEQRAKVAQLVAKGRELFIRKKSDDAIAILKYATELDSGNAGAWDLLGAAYFAAKCYEDAVAARNQVTAIKPDNSDAWRNLGSAYFAAGRYEDALSACDRAIVLDPTNGVAWMDKSYALRHLGRIREADAAWERWKLLH